MFLFRTRSNNGLEEYINQIGIKFKAFEFQRDNIFLLWQKLTFN